MSVNANSWRGEGREVTKEMLGIMKGKQEVVGMQRKEWQCGEVKDLKKVTLVIVYSIRWVLTY
jgi:hypothetical protein